MTILGIPMEKSIIIVLFASSLFALIFSIMSFMGKVNGIKNYTADGITEEKTTPDKKENIHKGHRQNLKKQFYEGGLAPMPDHVVLELLLFFGIPYKDTNEIAHNLINTFGTFAGVFRADLKDLMAVKGMTENAACLLKLLLPAYNRYTQSLQSNRTKFFKAIEIVEFMRPKYEGSYKEKVFLLCFDKMHQLIAVKHIATGDVSAASFSFRDIASIVLENKSRNVILVHNHPNAVPAP